MVKTSQGDDLSLNPGNVGPTSIHLGRPRLDLFILLLHSVGRPGIPGRFGNRKGYKQLNALGIMHAFC